METYSDVIKIEFVPEYYQNIVVITARDWITILSRNIYLCSQIEWIS